MPSIVGKGLVFLGNALIYPIGRLFRRDSAMWAFGAPFGRFEGNSKYLYLWLNLARRQPAPVWITPNAALVRQLREHKLQAFHKWSVKGLLTAARASIFFVNDNTSDINFSLSNGATIFNLWHGVGLKNVLYGAEVGTSARLRGKGANPFWKIRNMRRLQRPDWVLSTSPEMSHRFFARCFAVPAERAPALGYPRLDPHIDEPLRQFATKFDDYSLVASLGPDERGILYVPTLRETSSDFLRGALPHLDQLSLALAAQHARLYLKLHPKMAPEPIWAAKLPSNIRMLPSGMDIYPVLGRFAALVTDYSSLFFDFIALQSAGVVLYTFDMPHYRATERDLAWDYDEATLGVRANDFDELCEAIRSGRVFAPLEPAKLAMLRQRFWGGDLHPPTACERIRDHVVNQGSAR